MLKKTMMMMKMMMRIVCFQIQMFIQGALFYLYLVNFAVLNLTRDYDLRHIYFETEYPRKEDFSFGFIKLLLKVNQSLLIKLWLKLNFFLDVFFRQRSLTEENIASTSQHSPGSPSQNALQSPFNRQMRETAEFCEFFYKAKKIEKDFAELTLTGKSLK